MPAEEPLLNALDQLGHPNVLVVGDLILDRYSWGDAERVSQEAPVIVLRSDKREARLGGAANVCHMLTGLEAKVTIAGVVGDDIDGRESRELLEKAGVDTSLLTVDASRPTTVKERFIGRAAGVHPHQILRVDRETRDDLSSEVESHLLEQLLERLPQFDVVLISDYDKGVCTASLLAKLISAAQEAGVHVIVDPIRGQSYGKYHGAYTMTPNRLEAELATGVKIRTIDDAFLAGEKLCQMLSLEMAIVTLDRDGMALVRPGQPGQIFPTQVRSVYDITGAGDMVLSTIGVALAAGLPAETALPLANVAAGLEVEQVGVVIVKREEIRTRLLARTGQGTPKVLRIDDLARVVAHHKSEGKSVAFTNGCFDLLHVGHVTYLEEAASQGDILVVAVNSDASVRRNKGPTRPIREQAERAAVLAALSFVDYVIIFDEETPIPLLERLHPDVLIKGGDYQSKEQIVGWEVVEAYGGRVYLAGHVPGVSTTQILKSFAA